MTVFEDIWELLENIAREEELRRTAGGAAGFAALAGGGAAGGAILAGPVGGLVGGIGGAVAAFASINKFKSLPQVLREMNKDSKERIIENVRTVMTVKNITTVASLVTIAIHGSQVRNNIIQMMRDIDN